MSKKETKPVLDSLPRHALSGSELQFYSKGIKHFRGVFSLDRLPRRVWKHESAIVNLDLFSGPGTHWVCYKKINSHIMYYDSYGNLRPPKQLVDYWQTNGRKVFITFNYKRSQRIYNCGHLCLRFLKNVSSVW
jgi:hypothetical protein